MNKISSYIKSHKKSSGLVVLIILVLIYWLYSRSSSATTTQYTVVMARNGNITQTVSGTGQVSAQNQTDILSQVSGTIQSINVNVGDHVHTGDLIAKIDSSNAAISLENARISLAKLTESAKASDINIAQNSLDKAYSDGYNAMSSVYLDLPAIMSGMKDLYYSSSGFLSDQQSTYFNPTARSYNRDAITAYDTAARLYNDALNNFRGINRSSASSTIVDAMSKTNDAIKSVSQAVSLAQSTITFITTSQPEYNPKTGQSTAVSVSTWANQANSDLTALIAATNNITNTESTLSNLITGTDPLDIQSARLNLAQAQKTYDNYFIRAPYDGIIGRIPVSVYGQAGASTVIATIVGDQKISAISLNEVDAAKVAVGQTVNITFDAIDSLNATGTVYSVDQVGAVSSGVVSYGVKISIGTSDTRIKPGMSVNVSIITKQDQNVLIIPSSAIKSDTTGSYVLVADNVGSSSSAFASTTRNFNRTASSSMASSTDYSGFASSTRSASSTSFGGRFASSRSGGTGAVRSQTITPTVPPHKVYVTIGDADDTNTAIISGLTRGQFVVTKTTTASASATVAPSILSSLGANRGAAGGARPTGATVRPGN